MPLLIYYRKDGAIVHHHLAPAAWGPEELKKKIEEYNAEHPERPAYSLEVEPGSLTEYLLGKIQAEARRSDEAIEEALDALGQLTGRTAREEIVSGIFSRFCVGK